MNPTRTRFVGIDFGIKRIGIALSDERHILASPLKTLQAEPRLEATAVQVGAFLQEEASRNGYAIKSIVIGLPLRMSGEVGLMADETKAFAEALGRHLNLPIVFWDERLTSVQAERTLRESRMRRKKRAQKVDTVAAVLILQSYLDSLEDYSFS